MLDPMVSAFFTNTAQMKTLIELLQERADVQTGALADMRAKLAEHNLELQEMPIGTLHEAARTVSVANAESRQLVEQT